MPLRNAPLEIWSFEYQSLTTCRLERQLWKQQLQLLRIHSIYNSTRYPVSCKKKEGIKNIVMEPVRFLQKWFSFLLKRTLDNHPCSSVPHSTCIASYSHVVISCHALRLHLVLITTDDLIFYITECIFTRLMTLFSPVLERKEAEEMLEHGKWKC